MRKIRESDWNPQNPGIDFENPSKIRVKSNTAWILKIRAWILKISKSRLHFLGGDLPLVEICAIAANHKTFMICSNCISGASCRFVDNHSKKRQLAPAGTRMAQISTANSVGLGLHRHFYRAWMLMKIALSMVRSRSSRWSLRPKGKCSASRPLCLFEPVIIWRPIMEEDLHRWGPVEEIRSPSI